jgi:hypothetical protein
MQMMRCLGVLFLAGALMADAGAAVWYVDKDSAAPSPDGKTWAKAFRTLQEGINAASAAGSGDVWVAEGTYDESRSSQADGALLLKLSVNLYGGFAGNETSLSQRNWNTHVTIIDGSRGRGSGAAYHVVFAPVGSNSHLDGFTIRGGNANGGSSSDDTRRFGGGVYCAAASPHLTNLVFDGLRASSGGAALYMLGGMPDVTACEFRNGITAGKGAVYNAAQSITFEDCVFSGNDAGTGGAVYNTAGTPTFRGCSFSSNESTRDGGAVYNETASPRFLACAFTSNRAGTGSASNGGAVYNPGGSASFFNCTFQSNRATTWGGAIHGSSSYSMMNCSFEGNQASVGGSVFNAGSSPRFTNCVLWGSQPSEFANSVSTSPALVTYSDVKGGYTGTGNINAAPMFVVAGSMPLRLKPGSPCINKGINTNAPSTDFAGTTRPLGNFVDMGAFEGATCLLTMAVTGSGTVTPPPGTPQYYLQGNSATLTAAPAANWRFGGWSGGATGTQSPLTLAMSADKNVTATFIRQYTLTVQVQGTGTVTPGAGPHVYDSGAQVTLAVSAPTGWRFDHWEGALTGTSAPGHLTMSGDLTVKAVFVRTYTLTVAVQGNGTTNPAAGTTTYTEGTNASVAATPATGWRFDHWEGDASGTTSPAQVTMSANRSVTAVFAQIPSYSLTIAVQGSGSTNPAPGSYAIQENTPVSITAVPATNWAFDHWEGGATGSANPLSVTMTQSLSLKAVFTKIPLEIKSMTPAAGLSIGGTAMTLSVQSWTSNCRIVLGGKNCRLLGTTGSGTVQVRVAAPAITPGQYGVKVVDSGTLEEHTASGSFASLGDPFDSRLSTDLDTGVEIDDNNDLVTTYALRAWRGTGGMPALQFTSPEGVIVNVPTAAIPTTATGAFLLARIASQPGDLFTGATPLPDYRLRSAVVDLHVFVRQPVPGGGNTYSLLTAPASGTISVTYPLSPGPTDPLVSGGFETDLDDLFAALPPTPATFAEVVSTHTLDAQARAVFHLGSFGTVALFGDGPYQDINDDGNIDAADLQLVVKAAIGKSIGPLNADIDGDGKVSAVDIQMVVNAYLGRW